MPVRPENRGRYPADWPAISHRIRFVRAGGRCECRGECGRPETHLAEDGRCWVEHRDLLPSGRVAILTTAHRDHTPEHCEDANLFAACQGCHLHYDRAHHAETARATAAAARAAAFVLAGQQPLFDLPAR